MNFFISDTHFGHKNCMAFDNRPFATVEECDAAIINNWNKAVSYDDDVYLLGDMSWHNATKTLKILNNLNGNIHLIKGNHDNKILHNRDIVNRLCEITDYKELCLDKNKGVVLCHYPMPCFKNHFRGWYHLYGHVHVSFEENMIQNFKLQMEELHEAPLKMANVGCMMPRINYTPRTLEEIFEITEGQERRNYDLS